MGWEAVLPANVVNSASAGRLCETGGGNLENPTIQSISPVFTIGCDNPGFSGAGAMMLFGII